MTVTGRSMAPVTQTPEYAVARAVVQAAARVGNQAAARSAAQAEIILTGRPTGPAPRLDLRLTPAEEAQVRQLRAAPAFDLERILARGRVWRPREGEWSLAYAQNW